MIVCNIYYGDVIKLYFYYYSKKIMYNTPCSAQMGLNYISTACSILSEVLLSPTYYLFYLKLYFKTIYFLKLLFFK